MSNTKDNLQTAFVGESKANLQYLLFVKKVEIVTTAPADSYGGDAKWLR